MQMTGGGSLDLGFSSIAQQTMPAPATVAACGKPEKTPTPRPIKTPQPPSAAVVPPSSAIKRETTPAPPTTTNAVVDEQPLDLSRKPAKPPGVSSSATSKQPKLDRAKRESAVVSSKALDLTPICRS